MADEYKKTLVINVKPELDKASAEKIQEELSSTTSRIDVEDINKFKDVKESDYIKEIVKILTDIKKEVSGISAGGDKKSDSGDSKKDKESSEEKNKRSKKVMENSLASFQKIKKSFTDFGNSFTGQLKGAFLQGAQSFSSLIGVKLAGVLLDAINNLKALFEDAWNDLKNVINSSIENSGRFNATTSSLYAQYGITGENAYALQGALKETGYGDIDTLLNNPWTLTPEIQENLKDWFELYKEQYKSSKELSDAYQEFEIEFQKAQMEIKNSLIDFIVENKDLIIGALNAILNIMNGINEIIEFVGGRGESERRDAAYDIISSSGNTISSTFTMNNTYNGIGEKDATRIANTNSLAYAQIKKANL